MVGHAEEKAATRLREAVGKLTSAPEIGLDEDQQDRLAELRREAKELADDVEEGIRSAR